MARDNAKFPIIRIRLIARITVDSAEIYESARRGDSRLFICL